MTVISSKDNETIKHIRKLKDKKYRDEFNEYIIEGAKLINEAVIENAGIKTIIICEDCVTNGQIDNKLLYEIAKYNCIYVTENVFDSLTDVVTHQGIMAVMGKKSLVENINYSEDLIIILDDIQDPGNLGTILRTIDSVGLKQVILSNESTDAYSPKVVRSTMGAIFRINIIESEDLQETVKKLKKNKFKITATSLDANNSIFDYKFSKSVLIVGNESKGISEEIFNLADEKIKIPMVGKTESLNVSVATGIILYEYVKQKIKNKF